MHDWQVTSLLLQCKPNTLPEKGGASAYEYLAECTHQANLKRTNKTVMGKHKNEQNKRI